MSLLGVVTSVLLQPKLRDLPSSQSSSIDGTPSVGGAGDSVVEEVVPLTPVTFLATPPTPPVAARSPAVAKSSKQVGGALVRIFLKNISKKRYVYNIIK